jgi:hypothetical protein
MGINIWKNRNQLYLDIYAGGQRRREKLNGLFLTGDRQTDKETMRLANIAKAKRAQQVFCAEWNLPDPVASKQPLFSYLGTAFAEAKKRRRNSMRAVRNYLEGFPGGKSVRLDQINRKWIGDFQKYLLSKISGSSAALYDGVIRTALNRAVREKILPKNPAGDVPHCQQV